MFPELSHSLSLIYFWLFAGFAVLCGLGLLLAKHPIKGAVCLVGVMLSLSGLYAILHSPFLAVLQVLVYAGAIMMLVIFVIMILNQSEDHKVPRFDRLSLIGLVVPLLLGGLVVATVGRATPASEDPTAVRADLQVMSATLVDTKTQGWWVLFEAGGLLLLTAVVGAVMLAKRSLDTPVDPGSDSGDHHGHADRGTAIAMLHDHASAATDTATIPPGGTTSISAGSH